MKAKPPIVRRPLFCVAVRAADGSTRGESVALARLTKEAAVAAAEALADSPGVVCIPKVKRMNWRLVASA